MPEPLSPRQQLARAGLLEITPESTIGPASGEVDEGEGVVSYLFDTVMPGYPGWKWTVTVAQLDGAEPTVLEAELTPAEGALLAPDWVPWADRMDDYRAAQLALAEAAASTEPGDELDSDELGADDDSDDDDFADDDDDDDFSDDVDDSDDDADDDDFLRPMLHSGDLDGVDIDEIEIDDVLSDGSLDGESIDASALDADGSDETRPLVEDDRD